MLKKKLSIIISFKKTIDAMAFEELCLKKEIAGRLIPIPKEIDAGCGLAYKGDIELKNTYMNELKENGIQYDNVIEFMI